MLEVKGRTAPISKSENITIHLGLGYVGTGQLMPTISELFPSTAQAGEHPNSRYIVLTLDPLRCVGKVT